MIVNIDFSVFNSPTEAYGSVTGQLDVLEAVNIGDEISILNSGSIGNFSGKLRIISRDISHGADGQILLGLDDVVLNSPCEANALVQKLESEAGLFFDPYH